MKFIPPIGFLAAFNSPSFVVIYPQLVIPALIIIAGLITATALLIKTRSQDAEHRYTRR